MLRNIFTFFAFTFILIISLILAADSARAESNLVPNPSLEEAGNLRPQHWSQGRWGDNVTRFNYPVTGRSGRAAQVVMESRLSGDAKWHFEEVTVEPGQTYLYTDYYQASVASVLTAQVKTTDDRYLYQDLAFLEPSASWRKVEALFVPPAGTATATIFHLINRAGSLTIDDVSLVERAKNIPPTEAGNLLSNYSVESPGESANLPAAWTAGRWGANVARFEYPVAGNNSSRAVRVSLLEYASGDAKWYPAEVPITAGAAYRYADDYLADVTSVITVRFKLTNGNYLYRDIGFAPASQSWKRFEQSFVAPAGAVSATVFHLINQRGSLTTDNFLLKLDPSEQFEEGIVSFSFDDGWKSVYDNAIPILDRAGIKSTQYIVTERFDFPAFMTQAQVQTLYAGGHEIGSHSISHRDLVALPAAEAQAEITDSKAALEALGIEVKTFAYPFGAYHDKIIQEVAAAGYTSARSTNGGTNGKSDAPRYALRRRSVDGEVPLGQVAAWIDEALAKKQWLILTIHQVDDSQTPYTTSPEKLAAIVDYVKKVGAKTLTISEAVSLLK